jgi:hypothetical protein
MKVELSKGIFMHGEASRIGEEAFVELQFSVGPE